MKDAHGHGSDAKGAAHQSGVAEATGPKLNMEARASTYHPENGGSWDIQHKSYSYNGSNRKAAINWGLKKIQAEYPDHREHSVEIKE